MVSEKSNNFVRSSKPTNDIKITICDNRRSRVTNSRSPNPIFVSTFLVASIDETMAPHRRRIFVTTVECLWSSFHANSAEPIWCTAGPLEVKLSSKLDCPRRLRIATGTDRLIDRVDRAESRRAGAKVSIWICKIRMVKPVGCFKTQLNVARAFQSSNRDILVDLESGIIEARAMEEIAAHIPKGANGLLRKGGCVEPIVAGSSWIQHLDVEG